ncbi:hypothetical protein SCP_0700160 [Sparassis crispa]|uniref:Uncharacterized protein n=1 Tax=Sparassis crispa TaxID=139825 RepID=A0A401GRJ8_9APHY|nr:hypothetical protein SCP_0700160 [Sparassis crispa]GBE84836.1 hypothetical protein SCP_0700160 [Sparassis crispa]
MIPPDAISSRHHDAQYTYSPPRPYTSSSPRPTHHASALASPRIVAHARHVVSRLYPSDRSLPHRYSTPHAPPAARV